MYLFLTPLYLCPSQPSSSESRCSSQLLLRAQLRQSWSWSERMSSTVVFLLAMTLGVLVNTSMPSLTGYTQDATRLLAPLTSHTHTRHAPIALMSLR